MAVSPLYHLLLSLHRSPDSKPRNYRPHPCLFCPAVDCQHLYSSVRDNLGNKATWYHWVYMWSQFSTAKHLSICSIYLSIEEGWACPATSIWPVNFKAGLMFCFESLWLSWNLICRPGWSGTYRDPPVSASCVVGLKVCLTLFNLYNTWLSCETDAVFNHYLIMSFCSGHIFAEPLSNLTC